MVQRIQLTPTAVVTLAVTLLSALPALSSGAESHSLPPTLPAASPSPSSASTPPPTGAPTLPRGPGLDQDHVLEERPIFHSTAIPQEEVVRLARRVSAGEVSFVGSDQNVLRAVLRELRVPIASQVVVFSRTSLQSRIIRPNNPRAIYFSDSVYVGWVPDGLIEITAIDPALGPIFYAFDPDEARATRPAFVRDVSCVGCHGGSNNDAAPGRLFTQSLFTAVTGEPLLRSTGIIVNEQTPFERRWGGWYVTGYSGERPHRGNVFSREREGRIDFTPTDARPTELSRFFRTGRYLTDTSDVVALLVMEHQIAVHNALARVADRARPLLEKAPALAPADLALGLAKDLENLLDQVFFRDAAALPEGVDGNDAFKEAFTRNAVRDPAGHSLRDLSLTNGRLFANRCSYVLNTEAFTALPTPVKDLVLTQIHAALTVAPGAFSRYDYLEPEEKQRILAILTATHPDFRERFGR